MSGFEARLKPRAKLASLFNHVQSCSYVHNFKTNGVTKVLVGQDLKHIQRASKLDPHVLSSSLRLKLIYEKQKVRMILHGMLICFTTRATGAFLLDLFKSVLSFQTLWGFEVFNAAKCSRSYRSTVRLF